MVEKRVFRNGIPYVRFGKGKNILLVFSGGPGNTLPSGFMIRVLGHFKQLSKHYVIYELARRSGLPNGYSTRDMAEDYATVIKDEFNGGPLDVMGMSYGGLIAQHLAADYPELIYRLILAMSVYRFSEEANELDMRFAELLSEGKRSAASRSLSPIVKGGRIKKSLFKFLMGLIGPFVFSKPENPMDLIVEGKAEMMHNSKNRLAEIKASTLVIGGDKDYYCPVELLRETAAGISNSKLVLYKGKGHMIFGKRFDEDILAFLNEYK
jgi:pimeloyl-ACP methyl ester carboxylesterase